MPMILVSMLAILSLLVIIVRLLRVERYIIPLVVLWKLILLKFTLPLVVSLEFLVETFHCITLAGHIVSFTQLWIPFWKLADFHRWVLFRRVIAIRNQNYFVLDLNPTLQFGIIHFDIWWIRSGFSLDLYLSFFKLFKSHPEVRYYGILVLYLIARDQQLFIQIFN